MSTSDSVETIVPDTEHRGLIGRLPPLPRDLAQLARFDRPIGWWLLFWPGAWAIALAGGAIARWDLLLWFLIGAIAMRSAGCVYNDIVDRDLDRQVARTANRPLASGAVSLKAAWIWLVLLCFVGLLVLVQLNPVAIGIALASLALVAAYPFMKRITWWPQAWLGLTFNWGVLVGWATLAGENWGVAIAVYLGCVLFFGLSLVMAELAIGRTTQLNPVGAFRTLAGRGSATGAERPPRQQPQSIGRLHHRKARPRRRAWLDAERRSPPCRGNGPGYGWRCRARCRRLRHAGALRAPVCARPGLL